MMTTAVALAHIGSETPSTTSDRRKTIRSMWPRAIRRNNTRQSARMPFDSYQPPFPSSRSVHLAHLLPAALMLQ